MPCKADNTPATAKYGRRVVGDVTASAFAVLQVPPSVKPCAVLQACQHACGNFVRESN